VVNACDAGREGELIFRLIYELAGSRKPTRRMWLQSMTPDAIRDAFRSMRPGDEFNSLSDAAKCRSEADWLIGINGTRGITRLRERQTQAFEMTPVGRVQTPTLAIIVWQERKIAAFVPQDFWEVHGTFGAQAGTYVGRWFDPAAPKPAEGEASTNGRFFDRAQADAIANKCRGVAPSSVKDESKVSTSAPPKLFDLTSLQREANKRFKFSAKKTLDIAQALYEKHKATSYPRTDSSALPEDYIEKAKEVLGTFDHTQYEVHARSVLANGWVKPDKRIFDNTKISDHFAIIPTGLQPSGLDADEAKIYDMVTRRFIAAFHPAAEYNLTTRITVVAGESFKSSGKVLVKAGWLVVYGQQLDDDAVSSLCAVAPGEAVRPVAVDVKAMQTKPPVRFTEAALLSAMEGAGKLVDDDELRDAMKERGLGTPATRASIIEGLLHDRDGKGNPKEPYIRREGKEQHLVPTSKGMGLIEFLENNGIEFLTSPRMTGEWEQKLLLMEKGQYRRTSFMDEIAATTRGMIEAIRQRAGEIPAPARHPLGVGCPRCDGEVVAGAQAFECSKACGLKIRREICGRTLSEEEGARLFKDGGLKQLDGFTSPRTKRAFSAGLKLNAAESKADFVFDQQPGDGANSGGGGAASGAEFGVACPQCGGALHDQGRVIACGTGHFKLWKEIAGHALTKAEATVLISTKAHPVIKGFMSSKNKPFSAALRLKPDGKVEFEFQ
jgi:DNA topoisomerase-3